MKLAPSEFSPCQTLLYDYHKNLMVLVQEYVMAFGLTPASNIAQRLAHMIVAVIRKNFDEVEDEYMRTSATDKEKRWCAHRREVAKQSKHKEDRDSTALRCIRMTPWVALWGSGVW